MKTVRIELSKPTYAELMEKLPTEVRWYDEEEGRGAYILYGFDYQASEDYRIFVSVKRD